MTTPTFRSLLYREPRLYDLVFPDAGESMARMVRAAIDRWLPALPRSILDLGCGTGRNLEMLAKIIPECHGVDLLESVIVYAKSARRGITFDVGDMRTVRLGRTFDLVTCLGNALSYALGDDDLNDTIGTFAAHAHAGRNATVTTRAKIAGNPMPPIDLPWSAHAGGPGRRGPVLSGRWLLLRILFEVGIVEFVHHKHHERRGGCAVKQAPNA